MKENRPRAPVACSVWPKRQTGGRPSACTPEIVTAIGANLEKAMPLKFACEAEGVPWPTMEGWIRRGKAAAESDEKVKPIDALYVEAFHAFRTSVARAVKKLTISALAGGKGARQSMWLLERRFPKDYGTHQQIELSGKDGGPVATVALSAKLDELSVEDLRRLARGE